METVLTGNVTIDRWLAIAGAVVTVASIGATGLNARIRAALDAGTGVTEIAAPILYIALGLNYCAFNLDKVAQIHRMLRGQPVTVIKVNQ